MRKSNPRQKMGNAKKRNASKNTLLQHPQNRTTQEDVTMTEAISTYAGREIVDLSDRVQKSIYTCVHVVHVW